MKKRDPEFEIDLGGVLGRGWREEREGGNDVFMLILKENERELQFLLFINSSHSSFRIYIKPWNPIP